MKWNVLNVFGSWEKLEELLKRGQGERSAHDGYLREVGDSRGGCSGCRDGGWRFQECLVWSLNTSAGRDHSGAAGLWSSARRHQWALLTWQQQHTSHFDLYCISIYIYISLYYNTAACSKTSLRKLTLYNWIKVSTCNNIYIMILGNIKKISNLLKCPHAGSD